MWPPALDQRREGTTPRPRGLRGLPSLATPPHFPPKGSQQFMSPQVRGSSTGRGGTQVRPEKSLPKPHLLSLYRGQAQPARGPPLGVSKRPLSQQHKKGSRRRCECPPGTPECLVHRAAQAWRIRGSGAHSPAICGLCHPEARPGQERPTAQNPHPYSTRWALNCCVWF